MGPQKKEPATNKATAVTTRTKYSTRAAIKAVRDQLNTDKPLVNDQSNYEVSLHNVNNAYEKTTALIDKYNKELDEQIKIRKKALEDAINERFYTKLRDRVLLGIAITAGIVAVLSLLVFFLIPTVSAIIGILAISKLMQYYPPTRTTGEKIIDVIVWPFKWLGKWMGKKVAKGIVNEQVDERIITATNKYKELDENVTKAEERLKKAENAKSEIANVAKEVTKEKKSMELTYELRQCIEISTTDNTSIINAFLAAYKANPKYCMDFIESQSKKNKPSVTRLINALRTDVLQLRNLDLSPDNRQQLTRLVTNLVPTENAANRVNLFIDLLIRGKTTTASTTVDTVLKGSLEAVMTTISYQNVHAGWLRRDMREALVPADKSGQRSPEALVRLQAMAQEDIAKYPCVRGEEDRLLEEASLHDLQLELREDSENNNTYLKEYPGLADIMNKEAKKAIDDCCERNAPSRVRDNIERRAATEGLIKIADLKKAETVISAPEPGNILPPTQARILPQAIHNAEDEKVAREKSEAKMKADGEDFIKDFNENPNRGVMTEFKNTETTKQDTLTRIVQFFRKDPSRLLSLTQDNIPQLKKVLQIVISDPQIRTDNKRIDFFMELLQKTKNVTPRSPQMLRNLNDIFNQLIQSTAILQYGILRRDLRETLFPADTNGKRSPEALAQLRKMAQEDIAKYHCVSSSSADEESLNELRQELVGNGYLVDFPGLPTIKNKTVAEEIQKICERNANAALIEALASEEKHPEKIITAFITTYNLNPEKFMAFLGQTNNGVYAQIIINAIKKDMIRLRELRLPLTNETQMAKFKAFISKAFNIPEEKSSNSLQVFVAQAKRVAQQFLPPDTQYELLMEFLQRSKNTKGSIPTNIATAYNKVFVKLSERNQQPGTLRKYLREVTFPLSENRESNTDFVKAREEDLSKYECLQPRRISTSNQFSDLKEELDADYDIISYNFNHDKYKGGKAPSSATIKYVNMICARNQLCNLLDPIGKSEPTLQQIESFMKLFLEQKFNDEEKETILHGVCKHSPAALKIIRKYLAGNPNDDKHKVVAKLRGLARDHNNEFKAILRVHFSNDTNLSPTEAEAKRKFIKHSLLARNLPDETALKVYAEANSLAPLGKQEAKSTHTPVWQAAPSALPQQIDEKELKM